MERINYWALGVTLFIALTTSRLISDWIEWEIVQETAKQATVKLQQKMKAEELINAQRQEAENRNRAARDAEIARQQENYQAEQKVIAIANKLRIESAAEAQKKRMATCQFWVNEFNKTKSETDKNHRNNSCKDAGMNFN